MLVGFVVAPLPCLPLYIKGFTENIVIIHHNQETSKAVPYVSFLPIFSDVFQPASRTSQKSLSAYIKKDMTKVMENVDEINLLVP